MLFRFLTMFVLLNMGVYSIAEEEVPTSAYSQLVGFRLPNSPEAPSLKLAGVEVSFIEANGCRRELALMLKLETALLVDESCKLLLTRSGEELSVLNDKSKLFGPKALPCGSPNIELSARDFSTLYNRLNSARSTQSKDPLKLKEGPECKLTEELCVSVNGGASFKIACKDRLSVTISTNGKIKFTLE